MQKTLNRLLILGFISLIILMAVRILSKSSNIIIPVASTTMEKSSENGLSQKEIENVIDSYIMNNPEIILASVERLQQRRTEEIADKVNGLLEDKKNTSTAAPFLGNKDGNVNITVFYDYNCPYCKKGSAQMENLLSNPENKDVKVLLRPYPRDANSIYLAQILLSINKNEPDKLPLIHKQLLEGPENPTAADVEKILTNNGVNLEKIKLDIANTDPNHYIPTAIKTTYELANSLKINSVPTYIINGRIMPGAMNINEFQVIIDEMRKNNKKNKDNLQEKETNK